MTPPLRAVLVRLPHCADCAEFADLESDAAFEVVHATRPDEVSACELVILPGTKRTIPDLEWLRATGMLAAVEREVARGALLFGICGGFQMMGRELLDPEAIEGATPRADGLGVFDVTTTFTRDRIDQRVSATGAPGFLAGGESVSGFELHGGRSTLRGGDAVPLFAEQALGGTACPLGLATRDLGVMGTYLHGVLSDPTFRARLRDHLLERRRVRGS